jgi:hypothetical protein
MTLLLALLSAFVPMPMPDAGEAVEPTEARTTALPDQLAGLERTRAHHRNDPLFVYLGRSNLSPIVAVAFADVTKPSDWRNLARVGRGEAERAGLIETLFEGKFNVPAYPDARTYFGDYLTKDGVKQVWVAEYGGVRTTVVASIYTADDRRRVFDAIRRQLLGGAEMTAQVSPAEAN